MKRISIYHQHEPKKRTLNKVSMVQPDQTMSLRTILDRYSRGIPIESPVSEGYYNEQDESQIIPHGINYNNLDLTDKQEIRERAVQELTEHMENDKKQKAQKYKEQIIKEYAQTDSAINQINEQN